MTLHARVRILSAAVGGLGVAGMGMVGISLGNQNMAPETVLAPATAQMTAGESSDGLTTTTWTTAPSFRPDHTATPPPPPLDD